MIPLALEARAPALCPEIRLELLAPGFDLDADPRLAPGEEPPWWAFGWASGQALARWLLDHPEVVRGRRVLDFGAGSGIAAIAAARAGARRVVGCDRDAAARAAMLRNARRNGVSLAVTDALPPLADVDLLLAADVCYEPGNAAWLVAAGRRLPLVLVSDPGRPGLPRRELVALASYAARTEPELEEGATRPTVYRVSAPGGAPARPPG
ncbi:MAG: 50S ribosomal protein L11 methyltransferase [Myxococcota bacterium]|nr:50S ribosomal protein L11 methyltransferase [Myxococcota bacterium]